MEFIIYVTNKIKIMYSFNFSKCIWGKVIT